MTLKHPELERIVAVADGEATVEVTAETDAAIKRAHHLASEISARIPTYGRSTGVGAERMTTLSSDDRDFGMRLIRSHALDAGPVLPARVVRAMLAVRFAQLCLPGSGIDPAVPAKLAEMINQDALPELRAYGSIGTGDLAALAVTALTMLGERAGTKPLDPIAAFEVDSALPFLSSNALTIARCTLAFDQLRRLDQAGAIIYALGFTGLQGNTQALSPVAARATAAPLVDQVSARALSLVTGGDCPLNVRIQDPYGLRVYPISQAAFCTRLEALGAHLARLITTPQENPMFDSTTVTHHGAPFQAELGLAIDGTTLALAQTTPLALSRIRMINEPEFNRARAFLADGPAGSVGLMMLEYVAASAIAEIRAAAQPASLGTVVVSRGAEEDASFASQGAVQLERSVRAHRSLLACELVASIRLIRSHGLEKSLPPAIADAFLLASGALSSAREDRDLNEDLVRAEGLLDDMAAFAPPLA